jgi:pimeloyl-ACP methyl ester carboxylesterase
MVAKHNGLLPEIGRRDLMIGGAGAALLAAGIGTDGIAEAQTGPRPVSPPASALAPPGKIDVERRGLQPPIMLPGCGHWIEQEQAPEVSAALINFLRHV